MSGTNRTRRWAILDVTLDRLPPGEYTTQEIAEEFSRDLHVGVGRGGADNKTTGLLLRGKDRVERINNNKPLWRILPREAEA